MNKVLIIDDEDDLREVLIEILQQFNLDVKGLKNGLEALQCLKNERFDVILCDIQMPELSGMEFLEGLNQKIHGNAPLVFFSGLFQKDMLKKLVESGAFDIITKPVGTEVILRVVQNAIEASELMKKMEKFPENAEECRKRIEELRLSEYASRL